MKTYILLFYLLLALSAQSQVLYTDIEPDSVMEFGSWPTSSKYYYYDIDNNGVDDFAFKFNVNYSDSYVMLIPLNNSEIFKNQQYADTLNLYYQIDSSGNWSVSSLYLVQGSTISNDYGGVWATSLNKFIGFRLKNNDNYFYGWIRMKNYYTIRDFSVNLQSNSPFVAGSYINKRVENLIISDISNLKDGRDISISFEKAMDESKISSYRIIVVKSLQESTFTLDSANSTLPQNYTEVSITGADQNLILLQNTKDFNGELISEFTPYNVFILSIGNNSDSLNALSNPSNTLKLSSPAETITGLQVNDTYIGGNSYNMEILFNKINDESIIDSYRIIFVKSSEISSFNLNSANLVQQNNYYTITPNGNNYIVSVLSDTVKDKNGNLLMHELNYYAYVLTVADGISTNVNSLSIRSNVFNLPPTQDYRNIIIGDYYCKVVRSEYYPPNTWTTNTYYDTLIVSKDSNNYNKIFIYEPVACNHIVLQNWSCQYPENIDSTYYFSNVLTGGVLSNGSFFINNDSLYYSNKLDDIYAGYGYIYFYYYCNEIYPLVVIEPIINERIIYPNPASERIFINTKESSHVEIRNIQGILKVSEKINSEQSIDVSNLSKGVYFVSISSEKGVITSKLLIK